MENKTLLAKDKLAKAFTQYLMQKDTSLDDLTVGMLSSSAVINRITFYRNFESMLDFIKWFLLKDLIFKVDQGTPLGFEEAFSRLYAYIVHYRVALRKILSSSYRDAIRLFILDESRHYQLMNVARIDANNVLSETKKTMMVDFYNAGITQLIMSLIEANVYETFQEDEFLMFANQLVTNYIEHTIEKLTVTQ